jgi:hypothetical protein
MIQPEVARAGLRIGFLILLLSVGMLPFLPPSSAEFAVSLLAAIMALLFVGGIAIMVRLSTPNVTDPRRGGPTSEDPEL